ncbi:MAG: hypothetical protein QM642_10530 [Edaphocola sp.]
MKKYPLLTFLLILVSLQYCPAKLLVALNLDDCTSCYQALDNLVSILGKEKFTFVFPEKYRNDTAALNKKFYLGNYSSSYIWSDSLFKKILVSNISSVRYSAGGGNFAFAAPLKVIDKKNAKMLAFLENEKDSIDLKDKIQLNGSCNIKSFGPNLWILDNFNNKLTSYNEIYGIVGKEVEINDKLSMAAYDSFLGEGSYENQSGTLQAMRVRSPQRISTFWPKKTHCT